MKCLVCIVLACLGGVAIAQQPAKPKSADTLASQIQHDQTLHARALEVVREEQARAKRPLCPKAMNTLNINTCYSEELRATDGNYLKLVRALGALLRSGDETPQPSTPIPFDDAEAAWKAYREKACTAAGDQYEGGTIRPSIEMGCRLTITRHHMDELWAIYSDLGTR